jgi:hypothetical protein
MFSPDGPLNIDEEPTGLDYWVNRIDTSNKRPTNYYLTYRGVSVTLIPKRRALVAHEGRQKALDDRERYKGRGWGARFCGDVEDAITALLEGEGDKPKPRLGDAIRTEMARREDGGLHAPADPDAGDIGWYAWLTNDGLKILMGAWLHTSGAVRGKYNITKQSVVGIDATNEEFELTPLAMRPMVVVELLVRLASERQAHNKALVVVEEAKGRVEALTVQMKDSASQMKDIADQVEGIGIPDKGA